MSKILAFPVVGVVRRKVAPERHGAPDASYCPVCHSWYALTLRPIGSRCGDLSRGQTFPCDGLVLPVYDGDEDLDFDGDDEDVDF